MRRARLPFALVLPLALAAGCSEDAASPPPAGSAGMASSSGQAGAAATGLGGKAGSAGKAVSGQAGVGGSSTAGQAGAGQAGMGAAGSGGSKSAGAGGSGDAGASGNASGGAGGGGNTGGGTAAAGTGGAGNGGAGTGGAGNGGAGNGGGGAGAEVTEVEPNEGATPSELNPLTAGVAVVGAVGTPGDADVFKLAATPGKIYVARLGRPAGSKLQGHLAVFDAGRNKKAAGEDYVKIGIAGPGDSEAVVEILAMGEGGYLVAVRDERNVANPKANLGGAGFDYRLTIEELEPSARIRGPLPLPGTTTASFGSPGALHLYAFEAAPGMTLTADLTPANKALDGRFFVFSYKTNDWVARNDDRSASDTSPLFEQVPVQPAGPVLLLVENLNPGASSLGYSLASKTP